MSAEAVTLDCAGGVATLTICNSPLNLVNGAVLEGLTAALMEMVADEDLRRRCGEAAVETAEQYTMAAIGPKWDEMMQALLQVRAGRA